MNCAILFGAQHAPARRPRKQTTKLEKKKKKEEAFLFSLVFAHFFLLFFFAELVNYFCQIVAQKEEANERQQQQQQWTGGENLRPSLGSSLCSASWPPPPPLTRDGGHSQRPRKCVNFLFLFLALSLAHPQLQRPASAPSSSANCLAPAKLAKPTLFCARRRASELSREKRRRPSSA